MKGDLSSQPDRALIVQIAAKTRASDALLEQVTHALEQGELRTPQDALSQLKASLAKSDESVMKAGP